MTIIRGCELPEDLYYLIDKHVWAKPLESGLVRVGMTAPAVGMAGGKLAGVTVSRRKMDKLVPQGKSVATVESSKYVGPVPAPVTGTLVKKNEKLADDPNLAANDPYGEGWIAELDPTDWEGEKASLATGASGLAAYEAALEEAGFSCD
ncbi:MAG: glycine cleavage system protein H [Candidatus Promineifilaceae bacterium]|jgi:glycine cleavage system H protein